MKKLFLLFLPFLINAQDVPIGYWKDYQSYTSASYITEAENKIYCVTNGGLFYINKTDNTINRISKVTGLSDVGIKHVDYSETLKTTVITYENCNIDLIKNIHHKIFKPLIFSGGCGKLEDIKKIKQEFNDTSVALASVLHYKTLKISDIKKIIK